MFTFPFMMVFHWSGPCAMLQLMPWWALSFPTEMISNPWHTFSNTSCEALSHGKVQKETSFKLMFRRKVLCCLSIGVHLTPISLSLPYSHLIILFLPWITLWFHLSRTPWSPCDPYASPLPCVLLSSLLLIFFVSYSSYPVYITNPSLYVLLILVLLILLHLLIYPLPWLLLISNPCF